MLLPILFLGAAALLLVSSKGAKIYREKLDEKDILAYGRSYAGMHIGSPAVLSESGVAKVRAKLERQQTDLDDPLAILTLANLEQAFFHSCSAGTDKPLKDSAHRAICEALEALDSAGSSTSPVLLVSPRALRQGDVEWLSGFVITTGEPAADDFAPGGALEGCIRVGDYESLKSAKFC